MKYLDLLTGVLFAMAIPIAAQADVTLLDKLSGTGDNVIFDSLSGNVALGTFNGQHQGVVDFTDLSNNAGFTGASNGNDIKISNTSNLFIQVFDTTNTTILPTSTQVFSLKGTGDVTAFVQATDGVFTFDLGVIDPNAQSGFTLLATNGEVMTALRLFDTGGTISDYEHYRIDVATSAVPEPSTWAMLLLGFIGLAFAFRVKRRAVGLA
jgi:hypothetical protein